MLIKRTGLVCMLVIAVLGLSACHPRLEPVSGMDKQMSCSQLQEEINKTSKTKSKIASNRGISGRNALGLLFWPSIVINEVTGESAENEATQRLVDLKNIYAAKQCSKEDCAKDLKG